MPTGEFNGASRAALTRILLLSRPLAHELRCGVDARDERRIAGDQLAVDDELASRDGDERGARTGKREDHRRLGIMDGHG